MKVLGFFGDQANQRALAHKLAEHVPLAGLVRVAPQRSSSPKPPFSDLAVRAGRAAVGWPLRRAWFAMLDQYDRHYPDFPDVPMLEVGDINSPEVLDLVGRIRPDLVVVSGTNLLRQPVIEAIQATGKIINLHTGISPYVKGGPNCTNWCLALRRFDLIGNSVMWLDAGIDSGNLIATERTPLNGSETLTELHLKVMEHAHDLLVRCARRHAQNEKLPSAPQGELGEGRLFLSRHWTAAASLRAIRNFYLHYPRSVSVAGEGPIRLIAPEAMS
jgi:hypothetical protein